MRIAIDFDGTIANTYLLQQRFCKERFGIDLPLEASAGSLRKNFLVTEERIKETKEFVQGAATLSAPLVPGAREAIQKLNAAGHKIIILTGRTEPGAKYAKEYLKQNRIPYSEHFLYTSDDAPKFLKNKETLSKNVVLDRLKIDLMIDDQLKDLKKAAEKGCTIILLDQPWNQNDKITQGIIRLPNWKAILQFLLTAVPAESIA